MDDRQRVDRWLEEGQYLAARLLPALLEDRDRLQRYVEIAEWDRDRLRAEVEELRREIVALESRYRADRAAVAAAIDQVTDLVGRLHTPIVDVTRRLAPAACVTADQAVP